MKDFPLDKYKYYFGTTKDGRKKVIATSTFAKKTVRGVAICSPEDNYDEEYGKKLAAARCNLRIAELRLRKAAMDKRNATRELAIARINEAQASAYRKDAYAALEKARQQCDKLENPPCDEQLSSAHLLTNLNFMTWEQIDKICKAGLARSLFALGATKDDKCADGTIVTYRIIGFNADRITVAKLLQPLGKE